MEDLIKALDLRLWERVIRRGLVAEGDLRVGVDGVIGGRNGDIEFRDDVGVGEGDLDVGDLVLLVAQDVFLHALLGGLWGGFVFLLGLFLKALLFEVLQHFMR